MQWESDVAAGQWIRDGLSDDETLHRLVPYGFAAYLRILHPGYRERPVGAEWPPEGDPDAWAAFSSDIDAEPVSWTAAAAMLGGSVGANSEWEDIARHHLDAEGWRYEGPEPGAIDTDTLAAVASHLVEHTSTPEDGFAAVWDGWGGMVGFVGSRPSQTGLRAAFSDAPAASARHQALLRESFRDLRFRRKGWNPGLLDDDASRGARLETLTRAHVLFRADPRTWTDPHWVRTVPWSEGDEARSPSLVWPADRSWILVTDPEAQSTIVAGSAALIAQLAADPNIEAFEIDPAARDWAL